MQTINEMKPVTFDVATENYRHWRLSIDGRISTLAMNVDEDGGLRPQSIRPRRVG